MKKTISAAVAASILSSLAVAQNTNKAKQDTGRAKSIDMKQNKQAKPATKPGVTSGSITINPGIKPARQ